MEVSGNISSGIDQNEQKFNSRAPFYEISSGINYRAGKNMQLGVNVDYINSSEFKNDIGGYKRYNGIKTMGTLSIIF
jgi:hypothetical protein